MSKETITTKFGKIKDCWKIHATSNFDLGQSELDYWFSTKLGFVKFEYVNYGGQKLNIELIDIEENGI